MAELSLTNVKKRYGVAHAVRGVSLEVESGEFVSFLGPSGSGKTTTLSMVAGFVAPSEGQIKIGGQDVTRVPPYRRNIGMVFQDYSLFPHMTVEQNVSFPLQMQKVAKTERARRVAEVLETVGLEEMATRLPAELSGGQQQRVSIARAIVYKPAILLMDEPLGALDRMLRERLQLEVKHIQNSLGITTLYVTHDQSEALTMSDRVCVFNDGEIAQLGRPSALYEQPQSRFIAGFVGESNFLEATVRESRREGDDWRCVVDLEGGVTASVKTAQSYAAGSKLTASVRPEKVRLCDEAAARDPENVVIPARIVEVIYRGETTTLRACLENGTEIALRAAGGSDYRNRSVRLQWPAENMVLLNK